MRHHPWSQGSDSGAEGIVTKGESAECYKRAPKKKKKKKLKALNWEISWDHPREKPVQAVGREKLSDVRPSFLPRLGVDEGYSTSRQQRLWKEMPRLMPRSPNGGTKGHDSPRPDTHE